MMVVLVRIVVDDEQRRALRARTGRPGLANRREIALLTCTTLAADLEDAVFELRAKQGK